VSTTLSKQWTIAPPAPADFIRQCSTHRISPVLGQVLWNRGFDSPDAASRFLYVRGEAQNPFDLTDMSAAVLRIRQAIKKQEPIVVYGDFDADGVTATTVMVSGLQALGARVEPYIPNRVEEGYGLNSPALIDLAKKGVRLVITVDCGIRSAPEVRDGIAAGLDIVVTDHHSLGPELPDAIAVVNPQREDPPPGYAGVGVAYLVIQALVTAFQQNERNFTISANGHGSIEAEAFLESLLDLVAIGTVADLMPLNKLENRILVRRGLAVLNRAERPGVRALMEVAGVEPGQATATSIGYALGPRINAAGRLDDAMLAVNLLLSPTLNEAAQWAHELQALNTKRQDITRAAQDVIRERMADHDGALPLIFASDPSFEPGIVGLVAGRLVEEYFRPSIVMEEGETESRASCRSIPQFDITRALDECADLLVRHGGHKLAAGFTVINENIPTLRQRLLEKAAAELAGRTLVPTLDVDYVFEDVNRLHEDLVAELSMLEPCGHDNPAPVFMVRNVHVADHRTVGRDSKHLKLRLSRAGQPPLDAIGFGLGEWAGQMPDRIDVAFQLEINEWQGRRTLQANVQDIRPAGEE
jgi:single-stranded-DNA-specific exonuclease